MGLVVARTRHATVAQDEGHDDSTWVEALLSSVEFDGSFALCTVRYKDIVTQFLNRVSTRTRGTLVCDSFCHFRRRSSWDRNGSEDGREVIVKRRSRYPSC